jgi:hypothetical protein
MTARIFVDGIDMTNTVTFKNGSFLLSSATTWTIAYNGKGIVFYDCPVNSEHVFCQGSDDWVALAGHDSDFLQTFRDSDAQPSPELAVQNAIDFCIERLLPVPSQLFVVHRHSEPRGYVTVMRGEG